jgi:hypothetical protein
MAHIHQENDFAAAIFAGRGEKIQRGRPAPEAVTP